MSDQQLTVIVPTYNEEVNIAKCLESLKLVNAKVVVVDSKSTDSTQEIVKSFDVDIVDGEWRSFAEKMNWSLENLPITTKWVMRLDADEEVLPELVDELNNKLPDEQEAVAFAVRRRIKFLGKWIRFGGIYPSWQVRIWQHGKAKFEMRELDEHMEFDGICKKFQGDIVDDNLKGLHVWSVKHCTYAEREVSESLKKKQGSWKELKGQAKIKRYLKEAVYNRLPLFLGPFLFVFYRYFIKLGFLDGKAGLIYHFLHGFWYRFLIDSRIYEEQTNKE